MKKIVLASSNQGKMKEIRELLQEFPIELISQAEFNIPDADETGTTFFENAIIKARQAAKLSGLPALADDSGLVVDALGGMPGVYSARYAGPNASNEQRIQKLLLALADVHGKQRHASFHCVIAFLRHSDDPAPILAHGQWCGEILKQPRGDKGFGYDPVFYVPSHQCSAAELDPQLKNKISHRGRALEKFTAQFPLLS